MSVFARARGPWPHRLLSVLRMVSAALFFVHGVQKIFGVPTGSQPPMPFDPLSQFGAAGILEFAGGAALFLGVFTRPIAFILSGEMAVAYFQMHFPRSFFPILNGGELPVMFCFVFLLLAAAGGGPWSIDALIARARHGSAHHTPAP